MCGEWCRMRDDNSKKHRNLPWGMDLENENLKADLLNIFKGLDCNKLSKLDSTNRNEWFNNSVRSKAPKDKHYRESSSLQHRLAAAVCQTNEGYSYITKLLGNFCKVYRAEGASGVSIITWLHVPPFLACWKCYINWTSISLNPTADNQKQATLARHILGEAYDAHDALDDCIMLQKLVLETEKENILFKKFSFQNGLLYCHGVKHLPYTIGFLCSKTVISNVIAKKLLSSFRTYDNLELSFERGGHDGLYALLSERDMGGKPRVTKSHAVIKKLVDYFLHIE
ncbi:hypothetical protein FSP39_017890 [Pinctada imbricata]|uniref:PML C-terminal domain-containing protein n=1 Tax=Pinctada imbricata TaxID=66713 RepID=A0AA88YMV9_PINIB|nr:hypothetical protein FSP39_017890 [Pinctada imbricata]